MLVILSKMDFLCKIHTNKRPNKPWYEWCMHTSNTCILTMKQTFRSYFFLPLSSATLLLDVVNICVFHKYMIHLKQMQCLNFVGNIHRTLYFNTLVCNILWMCCHFYFNKLPNGTYFPILFDIWRISHVFLFLLYADVGLSVQSKRIAMA